MSPYIFTYKAIGITWFVFLAIVTTIVSYIIIKVLDKKSEFEGNLIEDTFFLLITVGFIGSRLTYVLLNLDMYKNDFLYIFKLSHFNLNLGGGIAFSLIALWIVSKRKSVEFYKLTNIFAIPLYLSLSIGVWTMFFDGLLLGKEYRGILSINYLGANRHMVILYLSILFIVSMIWEFKNFKKIKENYKYSSVIVLFLVVIIYYLIKYVFAY